VSIRWTGPRRSPGAAGPRSGRVPSPAVRALVQRVTRAEVRVADDLVGSIGPGLCVLVGVATGDDEARVERLASKLVRLRVFPTTRVG
jgi:hypothetical protein